MFNIPEFKHHASYFPSFTEATAINQMESTYPCPIIERVKVRELSRQEELKESSHT